MRTAEELPPGGAAGVLLGACPGRSSGFLCMCEPGWQEMGILFVETSVCLSLCRGSVASLPGFPSRLCHPLDM